MQGIALRAVARELGYSASSLLEHRNAGAFQALPDGSYHLDEVARGLLNSTSPNQKHRVRLSAVITGNRTKTLKPLTSEQKAAEDRGVAAVMALIQSDEVCGAMGLLGHLPRQMLAEFQKHDKIEYPENTLEGFERDTVDWLVKCIEAARDE